MIDRSEHIVADFIAPENADPPLLLLEQDERPGCVRVFASSPTYELASSWREPRRLLRNEPHRVRETLLFVNAAEAALTYPPHTQLRARWLGDVGPAPRFVRNRVHLSAPHLGVLEVHYLTSFDRWETALPCPVLFAATLGDVTASLLLEPQTETWRAEEHTGRTAPSSPPSWTQSWAEAGGDNAGQWDAAPWRFEPARETVVVEVVDYCTGAVVADADLWVDGRHARTDGKGRASFTELGPGAHTIRAVKDGYQATDEDTLSNERFTL